MKLLSVFIALAFGQNDTTPQPAPTTVPDVTTPSQAPTTPEPAPTTPEPSPTPKPEVPKEIKVLYDNDSKPCIMMQFLAEVQTPTNNYTIRSNETEVDSSESSCLGFDGSQAGAMVVNYNDVQLNFALSYNMTGLGNETKWKIDSITAVDANKDRLVTEDLRAEWIYGGIAYSCITGFTSNLTVEEQQNTTASISMSDLWVEVALPAFPIENDTHFSKAISCAADIEESLLVPIIVATALAGLVLAICVAYIIGRRKTYSGYNPM